MSLTFVTDGVKVVGATFSPKKNGEFVPGAAITLEGEGICGGVTNVVEDAAAEVITFDFTPPDTTDQLENCTLVATATDGTRCTCDVVFEPKAQAVISSIDCDCTTCQVVAAEQVENFEGVSVFERVYLLIPRYRDTDGACVTYNTSQPGSLQDLLANSILPASGELEIVGGELSQLQALTDEDILSILITVHTPVSTTAQTIAIENPQYDQCGIICEVEATAPPDPDPVDPRTFDCDSVECMIPAEGVFIGVEDTIRISMVDSNGDVIGLSDNPTFNIIGAEIQNEEFNNQSGEWEVDILPTGQVIQVGVEFSGSELADCNVICVINTSQMTAMSCSSVECVFTDDLVFGRDVEAQVKIKNQGNQNITANAIFEVNNGLLVTAPTYNATLQCWVFIVKPSGSPMSFDIVTDVGACETACETEVSMEKIGCNCDEIQCVIPDGGLIIGESAEIMVKIPDMQEGFVGDGVAFSFDNASINSPPVFNATTSYWIVNITPTAAEIEGSLVTVDKGECQCFCELTATEAVAAQCCKRAVCFEMPSMQVGVGFVGSIDFEDDAASTASGLPPGITYIDGELSGVPTTAGDYTITASLAGEGAESCQVQIKVTVAAEDEPDMGAATGSQCPQIQRISTPSGCVGESYSGFVTFTGTGSRRYVATGLPPGLSMVEATGQITGVPVTADNYNVTVAVSDDNGTCEHTVNMVVKPEPEACVMKPRLCVIPALHSVSGEEFVSTLQAESDASGSITMAAVGLPQGLTLTPQGVLSGIAQQAGTFPVTITLTQGEQSCKVQAIYTVLEPDFEPIMAEALPAEPRLCVMSVAMCLNKPAGLQLQALAGDDDVEWSGSGSLPPGVSFDNGSFVGEPTKQGLYIYKVTPTNGRSISIAMLVDDCCDGCVDEEAPDKTPYPHHHHGGHSWAPPPPPPQYCYWVKVISTAIVNGQEYVASLESPTNPIQVDQYDFYRLVENGLAIACPNQ